MKTHETIRDLAEGAHLLYYGDIAWFLETTRRLLSEEQVHAAVREHCYRFKLLGLFFDHIILPPSSLLLGTALASTLIRDSEVKTLAEGNLLITTYWPWCADLHDFAEELAAFLAVTVQQKVEATHDLLSFFKLLACYKRDTTTQSMWARDRLTELLTWNEGQIVGSYGTETFRTLRELARRAEGVGDIPFNLEKFGVLVAQDQRLPSELSREMQRSTWSIYFEGGVVGNYCGSYATNGTDTTEFEERTYRGVSRVFFTPVFLEFFLRQIGIPAPRRLARMHGGSVLGLRELPEWLAFRDSFWEVCSLLSVDLQSEMLDEKQLSSPEQSSSELALALRRALLSKPGGKVGVTLHHASRFLVDLGQSNIPLLQSLATYTKLDEGLERLARRLARPGLAAFAAKLRHMLNK